MTDDSQKPDERYLQSELRYRIADYINDRLKAIPYLHSSAKAAANWLQHRRDLKEIRAAAKAPTATRTELTGTEGRTEQPSAPGDLPLPPLEMRKLVGPFDPEAYDNPAGGLVYPWLAEEAYSSVFDFGCGCGRVARQLILQRPSPNSYVGVDLHAGMIQWCQENLHPAAPNFNFYHHDVFNLRHNPGRDKPLTAPFPVPDAQFTLVNALSVFTHLTEEQARYYLRECVRTLHPRGVLHASWFLFDKTDHPMMDASTNALYVSYVDPSAAVIFDRQWVRETARELGLRIYNVIPPGIRGYQWLVLMTKREDLPEIELPPDTAPRGVINPERRNETRITSRQGCDCRHIGTPGTAATIPSITSSNPGICITGGAVMNTNTVVDGLPCGSGIVLSSSVTFATQTLSNNSGGPEIESVTPRPSIVKPSFCSSPTALLIVSCDARYGLASSGGASCKSDGPLFDFR